MIRRHCTAIGLLAILLAQPAHAAIQAWLDHNRIAPGDTVQLTLQRDGQGGVDPDLAPLQQDFDVLGRSQSSNVQIINGSMSAQVQLQLTLSPKHAGQLTIPALSWAGEKSPALTLTVDSTPQGQAGHTTTAPATTPGVFIDSQLDNRQPYVQGAVHLKVRLYTSRQLYHASLDLPPSPDVLVQQLGQDRQSEVDRNGRHYQVVERDYLLFPQRSGALNMPGPVLDAQVARQTGGLGDPFDGIFSQLPFGGMTLQPLRLHGDAIALNVKPRPPQAQSAIWLPAQDVQLLVSWKPANRHLNAGEPQNLMLTVQARGLTASQLPDPASLLALPAGLRAYPDEAKQSNAIEGDTVLGQRSQNIALIADQPGHYTLPAAHLPWWSVTNNSPRDASVPAQEIDVGGTAGPITANAQPNPAATAISRTATNVDPPQITRTPDPDRPRATLTWQRAASSPGWQWASLGLGTLWIGTMAAWWWTRRRGNTTIGPASGMRNPAIDGRAARRAFLDACQAHDALRARRELLNWAQVHWPDAPPSGLTNLARRLQPDQAALLHTLDRACVNQAPWEGDLLAQRLSQFPPPATAASAATNGLPPLYP